MTDEQLLRRLAEIEGREILAVGPDGMICDIGNPTARFLYRDDRGGYEWSPLANWSDLGPLIEKYKIECKWASDKEVWRAAIYDNEGMDVAAHEALPHAICLAIVKAHER